MVGRAVTRRLTRLLEILETLRQTVQVGPVFLARRRLQRCALQCLQDFQHRPVLLRQQPFRYMQAVIGIDADQMPVESGMMQLGQQDAILHNRMAQGLVAIGNNMRRI